MFIFGLTIIWATVMVLVMTKAKTLSTPEELAICFFSALVAYAVVIKTGGYFLGAWGVFLLYGVNAAALIVFVRLKNFVSQSNKSVPPCR